MKRSDEARSEDDDAIAVPGAAARILRTGERDRRPAVEGHLLELSVGEETELSSVRRPERPGRPLRARQRSGLESVQRLYEQDVSAILGPRDERERSAVGRNLDRAGLDAQKPEARALWSIDRRANDARLRSRAARMRSQERSRPVRRPGRDPRPASHGGSRAAHSSQAPRRLTARRVPAVQCALRRCRAGAAAGPFRDTEQSASEREWGPRRAAPTSPARTPESSRWSPRPCRPQTPRGRSTSGRARSRRPRCRCACRPAVRAPARGSCRPRCRQRRRATPHSLSPVVRASGPEMNHRHRRPWRGRSREPSRFRPG